MSKFSEGTDRHVIEHFMRKARIERSLAIWAMASLVLERVKNIFINKDTAGSVCCAKS